jgi:hypothetical protein
MQIHSYFLNLDINALLFLLKTGNYELFNTISLFLTV